MKTLTLAAFYSLIAVSALAANETPTINKLRMAQLGCGIPPIPPIPPIGTSQCTPVCTCDGRGQNCHYTFVCR